MKNPIAQLFSQTAVYGLGIVLPRVLNYLLLTPFYTRVFEQASYGVITELYAYVVFLLVVLTYGMETGYFRFAGLREDTHATGTDTENGTVYTTVLASLLLTSTLFVAAVLVWSGSISKGLGYGQHPEYIRWLALIVAVDAFTSIPFARIRIRNRAVRYAVIRISEVLINIFLNFFFLYYCPRHPESEVVRMVYDTEIGVGYVLIANMIASLSKLIWLIPEIWAAFRSRIDRKLLRTILQYSYPLLLAGLAGTMNEALDRILLKHMIPESEDPLAQLGIYGANYKMAVLMTLFVQMFKYAAEPFFFSRSGDRNARKLYADVMTFFVASGLVIFLIVTMYLDVFILFIGEDFREGAHIVPVVLMANLVMGMFFNLSIWYKLTNRTMSGAVLVLAGAIITIAVNAIFIPSYGYVASAWGHLVCYTAMVVLSYVWSRKHYKVPYRLGRIGFYIGLALLIYLINNVFLQRAVRGENLVPLIFLVLFGGVVILLERHTFMRYKTV